jgi:hypothetical protein
MVFIEIAAADGGPIIWFRDFSSAAEFSKGAISCLVNVEKGG